MARPVWLTCPNLAECRQSAPEKERKRDVERLRRVREMMVGGGEERRRKVLQSTDPFAPLR